eukprot:4414222-Pleurochrysis_carterae.AAC.1
MQMLWSASPRSEAPAELPSNARLSATRRVPPPLCADAAILIPLLGTRPGARAPPPPPAAAVASGAPLPSPVPAATRAIAAASGRFVVSGASSCVH